MQYRFLTCLLVMLFFLQCHIGYAQQVVGKRESIYVIKNVQVITMTPEHTILSNATVVIHNNLIESINGVVPKNAMVIDGKGKWLIPGLMDAHVHLPTDAYLGPKKYPAQAPDIVFNTQDIMTPIIANGVTTVIDLNASAETFAQKRAIEHGYVLGPRIVLGAMINGGKGQGRIANSADEGRAMVRNAKAEGYDVIKPYSRLSVETFTAIIDEATKLGLRTVGHIPNAFEGKADSAFLPNFGMIAHAEELSKYADGFTRENADKFARLSKRSNTWLSPTLITMVSIAKQTRSIESVKNLPSLQYLHPLLQSKWLTANNYVANATPAKAAYFDSMVQFHTLLVKAFKEAGVPLVAGTDAGVSGVMAGFALHDELALLVEAGLTPEEALHSATTVTAQWLGISKQVGTIEVGKFADLVLLDKNPLTDISNTRLIAGVFLNGKWLDKKTIDAKLADLAKRNTADKDKFDWKTTINRSSQPTR